MCSTIPLVIIPSGDPICSQYNITLRNVQEYVDGGLLKTLHEESFMIYRQMKCDGTCQIGIFAAIEVDDCEKRIVRPHENVTAKTDITVLNKPKTVQQRVRILQSDAIVQSVACLPPLGLIHLLLLPSLANLHGPRDALLQREQRRELGGGADRVLRRTLRNTRRGCKQR